MVFHILFYSMECTGKLLYPQEKQHFNWGGGIDIIVVFNREREVLPNILSNIVGR